MSWTNNNVRFYLQIFNHCLLNFTFLHLLGYTECIEMNELKPNCSEHLRMYHWFLLNNRDLNCCWINPLNENSWNPFFFLFFSFLWISFLLATQQIKKGSCNPSSKTQKSTKCSLSYEIFSRQQHRETFVWPQEGITGVTSLAVHYGEGQCNQVVKSCSDGEVERDDTLCDWRSTAVKAWWQSLLSSENGDGGDDRKHQMIWKEAEEGWGDEDEGVCVCTVHVCVLYVCACKCRGGLRG